MKLILSLIMGCAATAWALPPGPHDYFGTWKLDKPVPECQSTVTIERGEEKTLLKMTFPSGSVAIHRSDRFPNAPTGGIRAYEKIQLSAMTVGKFIRGKIVTAHIWEPQTNEWLGVGIRVWKIANGKLVKQKTGVTLELKSKRDSADEILDIDSQDSVHLWKLECTYSKQRLE